MSSSSGRSRLVLVVFLAALLIGGAWFYQAQQRESRRAMEANLRIIGEMKVEQVVAWRAERERDAAAITGSRLLSDELKLWLKVPSEDSRSAILAELRTLVVYDGYDDAYVVSPDGAIVLSYSGATGRLDEYALPALREALETGRPVLTDLHSGASRDTPHLSAIAPVLPVLRAEDNGAIGAIVLITDASRELFPIIRTWPSESRTAETLLVRRDGGDVLFMNDLRHQPGAALKLRFPATTSELPATRVLSGEWGFVQGRDYRGVEVAAVVLPVPGTEWAMVAKEDASEVFAAWRFRSALILAGITALAVLLAAHAILFWQRAERSRFEKLYRSEKRLRESDERYGVMMRSIADGVVSTDVEGRVETLNPVAEMLTGWTDSQARGRPMEEILHIVDRHSMEDIEGLSERVLREGDLIGIPDEALLISKNGSEKRVAGGASPMLGADGQTMGAVVVFQDISERERAREVQSQSDERWRAYVERAPHGVFIANERGEFLEVNPAASRITGYSPEELLSRGIRGVSPSEDRENSLRAFKEMRETGEVNADLRFLHKSGGTRWIAFSGVKLSDTRYLGFARDVTDRREAEMDARRSSSMLERVFDVLPVGLWFADREGTLLRGNPAGVRIWGSEPHVSPSEYGVFKARRLPSGEEVGADDWSLLRAVRDGETVTDELLEIEAHDGKTRIILNSTAPIFDDVGVIQGGIVVNQDITDLEKALAAERTGEERWRTYVERAPYGVFIANERGEYIEVNPEACLITGYSADELLSMSITDITPPECRVARAESFRRLREAGETEGESAYLHKSGEERWWLVSAVKLSETRYLGFVSDTTERRRSEAEHERLQGQLAQAQKMESVGRLAGGVAHDFNNMLQVILGNTEIALASPGVSDRVRGRLVETYGAAENSARLTKQLLAFARQQPAAPEVLNLNDTVSSGLKMLRRLIGEDISLTWIPAESVWSVKIDPTQVDQILANLCVNARDALPGTGVVTVSTVNATLDGVFCAAHPDAVPGDYVVLSVSDTGVGMDGETLSHIFDPFFTTKDPGHGTGLGLATVYGIVKQNGGSIDVESEPGQGSVFRIYLPRFESILESAGEEPAVDLPKGDGETVLIVEDETSILGICSALVRRLGYSVLTAESAHEALAFAEFANRRVDLLLTDVVMPKMNGKELSTRLSVRFPDMRTLYMSGYTSDVIARKGILEDGVFFMQKPFALEDLATKLRDALESQRRPGTRA